MTTHRHSVGKRSPTYFSWSAMKQRCLNPKHTAYYRYGGRGISVCDKWLKFDDFLKDMGERPEGFSLDRINNNGNYEPSNCSWSSRKSQSQNRNDVKLTMEVVNLMRSLYEQGATQDALSKQFGVTQSHVCRIVNKEQW